MRITQAEYGLPIELLRHFQWARTHRYELIKPQIPPTLPIRIKGEVFDVVYNQGPVLKLQLAVGTGRLLGVA